MAPPPVAGGSRGRRSTSRRNRKVVQHYTDSNPSTFTTKKPRGAKAEKEKPSPPKPRGRRRRRTETTTPIKEPPSPPPPPRSPSPPLRPPSPLPCDHVLPHGVTIAPVFPPPPVIPSFSSHESSIRQTFRSDPAAQVAFGRGLGVPRPIDKPEWTQVRYHDFYHPLDYQSVDKENGPRVMLKDGATSVARSCTCLASSVHHLAVGDTAGFVSIYSLGSLVMPLALLNTTASYREYKEKISHVGPAQSKYGFRVPDIKSTKSLASQHANAIEALCILDARVALSTKDEVEVIDIAKNQIIWTMALTDLSRGPAVKLDLHPSSSGTCLASFWYNQQNKISSETERPLVMYEQQDDSVKETAVVPVDDDDDKTLLRLGSKCAAMWDRSDPNRMVVVSLVIPKESAIPVQELLLIDRDSFTVIKRAPVPLRVMGSKTVSTEALSQSPLGKFTLVASTRGIRLFETSTLSLLHVYGETVSLHGHGIVWQDCFLVRLHNNTDQEDLESRRNGKYLERPDELRYRHFMKSLGTKEEDTDEFLANALVVGVPHAFRQPVELKNTLHFWDAHSDGKHTAFTIAGPPKANGIVTAIYSSFPGNGSRLVLSTQQGDCLQMVPTLSSEFPGIMYPPGYHVIDDNLEYIEDEDELDLVVAAPEEHEDVTSDEEVDDDLAEAVRRSVLEHKAKQEELEAEQEMDVNVVDSDDDIGAETVLACHPEPYLQQDVYRDEMIETTVSSSPSPQSPEAKDVFCENFLSLLPQAETVVEVLKTMDKSGSDAPEAEAVASPPPVRTTRGKRSRTANLEALIKASIDPRLRAYMMSREKWAGGEGSTLRPSDRMAAALGKQRSNKRSKHLGKNYEKAAPETFAKEKPSTTEASSEKESDANDALSTNEAGSEPPLAVGDLSTKDKSAPTLPNEQEACKTNTLTETSVSSPKPSTEAVTLASLAEKSSVVTLEKADINGGSVVPPSCAPEAMTATCSKKMSSSNGAPAEILSPLAQPTPIPSYTDVTSTPSTLSSEVATIPTDDPATSQVPSAETVGAKETLVLNCASNSVEPIAAASGQVAPHSSDATVTKKDPATASTSNHATPIVPSNQRSQSTPTNGDTALPEEGQKNDNVSSHVSETDTSVQMSTGGRESGENASLSLKAQDKKAVNSDYLISHCDACCGRMVIHVCGKRELPVDFEAIARAEKEKREKEKAEKLKARIEKRRLADQKRREAKRQKKLEEEQRKKREAEERRLLELEEAKLAEEAEEQRRQEDHHVKERRRAEILQRLMEAQKEQNIAEAEERRPESISTVSQYAPTNAAEVGRRLEGLEYYSNTAERHSTNSWAPPPSPAVPSNRPADNRTDALEALASLANGFVGASSSHQQSQSPQFPSYNENNQVMMEASMSAPSYSASQHSSSNASSSFATETAPTYFDNSNYGGQVGVQYASSSAAADYSPAGATNTSVNTPSSYASATYNEQHHSSGTPLSPPPAFTSRSHEFGQTPLYNQGAGHTSSTYNHVPHAASVSCQSKTEHGFGSAPNSSGQGQQSLPIAGARYPPDPDTASFREQVRQGFHIMSSFNGHSDQRESVEAPVAAGNRYEQTYMGNSSTGSAIGSVTAGNATGSTGSIAPNIDTVSYSGIMPHYTLPQRIVPVTVAESNSTNHDDVNNR